MAATNYSPIQLYYSTTASAAPAAGNLVSGELAINITDGKLYYKDNAGTVQLLSTSTTANGTANGVLYLNGSKVATSGSALTFDGTSLSVGTSSHPSTLAVYAATGGSTTGLTVNASGNMLNLFGSSSTNAGVIFDATDGTVGSATGVPMIYRLGGSEQMRLTSTGLGIGTSSPTEKLTVAGAGLFTGALSNYRTNAGAIDYFGGVTRIWGFGPDASTAGIIDFHTTANDGSPDNTMRFDSSGNLGLGVTPSAWASTHKAIDIGANANISGSTSLNFWNNSFWNGSNTVYKNTNYATLYAQSNAGQHQWYIAPSGTAGSTISFTQAMTLDASGNLSIGTSSPFSNPKLSVYNSATLSTGGDGGGNGVLIAASTGAASGGQLVVAGSDTAAIDKGGAIVFAGKWDTATNDIAQWAKIVGYKENATNNNYSAYLGFYTRANGTSQTEKMRLDSSGNLGLGATSMSLWGTASNPAIYIKGTNSGYAGRSGALVLASYDGLTNVAVANDSGSGALQFYIGTSEKMRLDASGNLNVGGTLALGKIYSQTSAAGYAYYAYGNFTSGAEGGIYTGASYLGLNCVSNHALTFATNNTERARIDSSGNFLVGTTSNKGSGITAESVSNTIWTTCTVSGQSALVVQNTNGGAVNLVAFQTGSGFGSGVGSIYYSAGLTVYATTSDYRLKNVIGEVTGSGARIDALEPVEYEWKSSGERTRGFLAHKFQEVYPQSVSGEKDAVDENGNPKYQQMQASTTEVIADLVAEIQSLRKRLADAGIA